MPYMTYCPDSCLCSVTCRNASNSQEKARFAFKLWQMLSIGLGSSLIF